MDTILQLSQRQRVELFEQIAQQTGMEPVIIEKDFWVDSDDQKCQFEGKVCNRFRQRYLPWNKMLLL